MVTPGGARRTPRRNVAVPERHPLWRTDGASPRVNRVRGAMAIIRRPVRSRPIRLFLISMFAVPLVSLVALWAFGASVTVPAAISDHNYNEVSTALNGPGVATLTEVLPVEQEQTYLWLLGNRTASNAA